MVSQRHAWKRPPFGWISYECPTCHRDKGMLYLTPEGIRYVCFCGANISVDWIKEKYDFKEKSFQKKEV